MMGKHRRWTLIMVVAAILTAVPIGVIARHQFTDVPNTHTFHNQITWMANHNITFGCNPPANTLYCPEDPVTRGQMAAFLERFYENLVRSAVLGFRFEERDSSGGSFAGNGVVLSFSVNAKAFSFLVVQASSQMENVAFSDVAACGISTDGSTTTAQADSWRVIDLSSSLFAGCNTQTAVLVPPGDHVVKLVVAEAQSTTLTFEASLMATLHPATAAIVVGSAQESATEMRPLSDTPAGKSPPPAP